MHYELSKPQKKIGRALIERGLMKEYHKGISMIDRVMPNGRTTNLIAVRLTTKFLKS